MQDLVLSLYVRIQSRIEDSSKDQNGQDLIEYALVVSLLALAAAISMRALATSLGTGAHPVALSQHADRILKRLVLALVIVFRAEIVDLGLRLV